MIAQTIIKIIELEAVKVAVEVVIVDKVVKEGI